jgi:hypothetical protein
MVLTHFHAFKDSVRWRLTAAGVDIEGSGVERTKGAPATVTRVWESYDRAINQAAQTYRVPCALIIATICTESGGKPDAVCLEPGYQSDEATPHKVSPGLMQTLISTARNVLQMSLDRAWLLNPAHSILAGTAYIAHQARVTGYDPPLVAAAYNAGRLVYQNGAQNRWKLRQYPLGTGAHCDRFVRFFNDAVAVLSRHASRPAVGLDSLLEGTVPSPTHRAPASSTLTQDDVRVTFGQHADPHALTAYSQRVLADILQTAKLTSAQVSSTSRSPADQARVMFDNLERYGVEPQKKLYGPAGDKVIAVYVRSKAAQRTDAQIKLDMAAKIKDVGPTNVSRHASDPHVLNVFDIAPSSIADRRAFERAVHADKRVSTFLMPPEDPGYHLEIPQPVV